MFENFILPHCVLYKGEYLSPYDDYARKAIWNAEKSACNELAEMVDLHNINSSLYEVIKGLIGKWCPMEFVEIMTVYDGLRKS